MTYQSLSEIALFFSDNAKVTAQHVHTALCYVQSEALVIVLESSLLLIYLDFQSVIFFSLGPRHAFPASLHVVFLIHMHFLLYFLGLISF